MNKDNSMNDVESFGLRLSQLREAKDYSARDMSLRLGHNKNYINQIECRKSYPTMESFFNICDYLKISPKDFFDPDFKNPSSTISMEKMLHKLTPQQYDTVYYLIRELTRNIK